MHTIALRPSCVPQRVVLPSPPTSSLPHVFCPESDRDRVVNPTVTCLIAMVVNDPSFQSTVASALVAELVDFAALCRLDYVATATTPHLVSTLLCLEGDPDALDIPTPRSYADAITGPYSSHWQMAMDAEMASWKSTGNYVNAVPQPSANIVDDMWIFKVKRPLGFPPAFKARYVARGFSQHEGTTLTALGFAPSTSDPSMFLRKDTSLPPFYALVYVEALVFATADTEALALVLQFFGFSWSSPQPTPLPTGHSLSPPCLDESVEPSGPYPELMGCLTYLMTCTQPDLAYPLSLLARYVAPGDTERRFTSRHRGTVSASALVLSRGGPLPRLLYLVLYAEAMASQELRWLTYLLTDLGERPHSPPVLYVDNKAIIALCHDQRVEHRTKHISLCYFITRELQQRGQLRLAYVAIQANTADFFTKALGSGDHQRFCNTPGLVPILPHPRFF
ncbi:unnamed protein product [Closterium sp. NIES-54]